MGLIMTRARILRLFAIASRSSVLRAKLFGNTMPGVGTGGSAGEDAAGAGATGCLGCSTLAGDSAFLLQATTRKAVKSNKGTRNRRDEFEGSGIHPPLANAFAIVYLLSVQEINGIAIDRYAISIQFPFLTGDNCHLCQLRRRRDCFVLYLPELKEDGAGRPMNV